MNRKATIAIALFLGCLAELSAQITATGFEKAYMNNVRQLVLEGKRSGEGYFSSDGRKLIFQSEREADNPFYQIYILDFESGDVHRVSPGHGKTTCAFFRPNSNQVLFSSTHEDPKTKEYQKAEIDFRNSGQKRRYSWDYDPSMDIFICNQDGSGLRNLTNAEGYDAEGAFSPDGNMIVFASNRSAFPQSQLNEADRKKFEIDPAFFCEVYLMNADGTGLRRLTNWPGYDGGTFFSPDGKRIIFRHFNEEGTVADVYTMKLDGSDLRRLTDFECLSWAPYYHPSQEYVAFAANKEGFSNFEIYLTDTAGRAEPVRVSFKDGFDGLPVFSPDGRRMCWTSSRTSDKSAQLFIADWNDAAARLALGQAPYSKVGASKPVPATGEQHLGDLKIVNSQITAKELQSIVEILASDSLEGRMTGTDGSRKAAELIAKTYRGSTLKPFDKDYRHSFGFSREVKTINGQNSFVYERENKRTELKVNKDYAPLSTSSDGKAEGQAVFVGYGLSSSGVYDSYGEIDLRGKLAVVLDGLPAGLNEEQRRSLLPQATTGHKTVRLRERGASGVIVVRSLEAGKAFLPLSPDFGNADLGIPSVSVGSDWLRERIAEAGGKPDKILDTLNQGKVANPVLLQGSVSIQVGLERVRQTDYNVVGYILPKGKSLEETDFVVIGAHYDHLGKGHLKDASRSSHQHKDGIHNGADDNASGTAAVMQLVEYFADKYRKEPDRYQRGLIFACWSGEEMGLIGSQRFVAELPVKKEKIAAYVNFDMVGSLRENQLFVQGIGSAEEWKGILEKKNVAAGFDLKLQEDPWLPTDATSFYAQRVPVAAFFTGLTEYYHTVDDDPNTLNYEGMERVAKFAAQIIDELAKSEKALTYKEVVNQGAGRRRMSSGVYLGTIPDYAGEGEGMLLSGVRAGGPAEQAGLKGGDRVVQLDGKDIRNIYDFTGALDGLKVGKTTTVIVLRGGQRIELKITPGARD